jgi:hypothetical protein
MSSPKSASSRSEKPDEYDADKKMQARELELIEANRNSGKRRNAA